MVVASPVFPEKHIGGGQRLVVPYYSPERKAALLKMLLPPLNLSMAEVSRREGGSQMPVDQWHAQLGDPTLGEAILDRLVHNAYRIELKGESMRRRSTKLTAASTSD